MTRRDWWGGSRATLPKVQNCRHFPLPSLLLQLLARLCLMPAVTALQALMSSMQALSSSLQALSSSLQALSSSLQALPILAASCS